MVPVKLYRFIAKKSLQKDFTLDMVRDIVEEVEVGMSYDEYIEPQLLWATEDKEKIAIALDVERVVPKGAYIMGLFGGEEKRGKLRYAGLVIEGYRFNKGVVSLKLTGLSRVYEIPVQLMKQHNVNLYKLYYRGLINPFKCRTYNVLLSATNDSELKEFLRKFMNFNREVMPEEDSRKLKNLVKELRTNTSLLNPQGHYVIYRCNRAFTACVPTDLNNAISESHTAYIKCRCGGQAYYYAAALNYLAYKVVESKRAFIRDQFARPLITVATAGLSWKDVPKELRIRIAKLSKMLSDRLTWRKYNNQKQALLNIIHEPEFKEIISLFDNYITQSVGEETLSQALDFVSTFRE